MLLQQRLTQRALEWCEANPACLIVIQDKAHRCRAEIADTIEDYDAFRGVYHGLFKRRRVLFGVQGRATARLSQWQGQRSGMRLSHCTARGELVKNIRTSAIFIECTCSRQHERALDGCLDSVAVKCADRQGSDCHQGPPGQDSPARCWPRQPRSQARRPWLSAAAVFHGRR